MRVWLVRWAAMVVCMRAVAMMSIVVIPKMCTRGHRFATGILNVLVVCTGTGCIPTWASAQGSLKAGARFSRHRARTVIFLCRGGTSHSLGTIYVRHGSTPHCLFIYLFYNVCLHFLLKLFESFL